MWAAFRGFGRVGGQHWSPGKHLGLWGKWSLGAGASEGSGRALGLKAGAWQAEGMEGFMGTHRASGRETGLLEFPASSCLISEPVKDPRPQNLLAGGGLTAHS